MRIALYLAMVAVFVGAGATAHAQKGKKNKEQLEIPEYPMQDGKVVYSSVETVEGSQQELFEKAGKWFRKYYKNPSNVIQSEDEGTFTIVGKHRFPVFATDPKTGQQIRGPLMMYKITVVCKDGRYKYDITEVKQKASTNIPIEKLVTDQRASYRDGRGHHLIQVDEEIKAVVFDLKKYMAAPPEGEAEEW